jgi:hypothetical protein
MQKIYELDLRCAGVLSGGEDVLLTARNFAEAAVKAEKLRVKIEKDYSNRLLIHALRCKGDLRA